METGQPNASDWHELLKRPDVLVLDTETTGLDSNAEIVEIAAIDTAGTVQMDELVMPRGEVPKDATDVHGLTRETLEAAGAKSFHHLAGRIEAMIAAHPLVLIYNKDYDLRLLEQSAAAWGMGIDTKPDRVRCMMLEYSDYRRTPNTRPGRDGFKWHRLERAVEFEAGSAPVQTHRALDDCRLTLRLIETVARRLRERDQAPPPPQPGMLSPSQRELGSWRGR